MFIERLFESPYHFFMVLLIVVFSVCLHEFFHAWAAVSQGDESVRDHLTLNPLKQMGVMSLIMFLFLGIAWGSVAVRKEFLQRRKSALKIALAGPFANLLLFLLALLVFFLLCRMGGAVSMEDGRKMSLIVFILTLGMYNFVLLVFNLLPVPGLDGWLVVQSFFPEKMEIRSEWVKGIMAGAILGAFFLFPYLFKLGYFMMVKPVELLLN